MVRLQNGGAQTGWAALNDERTGKVDANNAGLVACQSGRPVVLLWV